MTPFLSFMIPVYNGEDLVEQAIESVLNQPCKDLELIIMDDGSTDRTREICEQYAAKDSRVRFFTHENVGLGKNRNLAYPHLRGEWTIFLDHDDLILNGFYNEKVKDFLKKCAQKNIQVVVPSIIKTGFEIKRGWLGRVPDLGMVPGGREHSWKIKYEFASLIYATKLFVDNKLYFYEKRPEVETRFRHQTVYCSQYVLFEPSLYFYIRRANAKSITHTWNLADAMPVRIQAYDEMADWHRQYDPTDKLVVDECREYIKTIICDYIDVMKGLHFDRDKISSRLDQEYIRKYMDSEELFRKIDLPRKEKKKEGLIIKMLRKVRRTFFWKPITYYEKLWLNECSQRLLAAEERINRNGL